MLKKKIKYTDYNGIERTEEFHFNLTKTEVVMFENSVNGGMSSVIKAFTNKDDVAQLMDIFKRLIEMSYGEKSIDGKRFKKVDEVTRYKLADAFIESPAFDELYMELMSDPNATAAFINGLMPMDVAANIKVPDSIEEAKEILDSLESKQ